MTGPGIPACWTWPVTEQDHERAFLAAGPGTGYGRDRGLALIEDWQAGRCAICSYGTGQMEADHDHQTGYLRGMLCHSCNVREAHAWPDDPLFSRYRQRPPSVILGVRCYWSAPEPPLPSAEALRAHQAATDPASRR